MFQKFFFFRNKSKQSTLNVKRSNIDILIGSSFKTQFLIRDRNIFILFIK